MADHRGATALDNGRKDRLAEHAAKLVADWPTPPLEVLNRIAAILRGGTQ
jgi:hypothetical protein